MEIIEFEEKYRNQVTHLLVELQSYLAEIDDEKVQIVNAEFRNNYLDYVLDTVKFDNGKIYLAVENNEPIGLIAGTIEQKDREDELCTNLPVRGVVTELVVSQNNRGKGVGKELFSTMETYFKIMNCEFVSVNVFALNKTAISFYQRLGYKERNIEMIRKL